MERRAIDQIRLLKGQQHGGSDSALFKAIFLEDLRRGNNQRIETNLENTCVCRDLVRELIKQSREDSSILKKQPHHIMGMKLAKNSKVGDLRSSLLERDQHLHPFKYKIVAEVLGVPASQIFTMKDAEVAEVEQIYLRKKGLQNLEFAQKKKQKQLISRVRTQEIQIPKEQNTPSRSRNYVRDIFKDVASSRALKSEKQLKKHLVLSRLEEKEQELGYLVYHRVKTHLQTEKKGSDFSRQVRSEEKIDQALIDFLKAKIEKVEIKDRLSKRQ